MSIRTPIFAGVWRGVALPRARVPVVRWPSFTLRDERGVALASVLTFVIAMVLGVSGIGRSDSVALGASTTLTVVRGGVSVSNDGVMFGAATDGDVVRAGTTIRTSAEAYAVITYFDGSTVAIEPNTSFTVASLDSDPGGARRIWAVQSLGRTWHAVQKALGWGSRYEVTTPTLTASVRGTVFAVTVAVDERGRIVSTVETTEGAVAVSWPGARGIAPAEVVVTAGRRVSATTGADPEPVRPVSRAEDNVAVDAADAQAKTALVTAQRAHAERQRSEKRDRSDRDGGDGPGGPGGPGGTASPAAGGFVPHIALPQLPFGLGVAAAVRAESAFVPTERLPVLPVDRGTSHEREDVTGKGSDRTDRSADAAGPGVPVRRNEPAPASQQAERTPAPQSGFVPSAPLPEIPTLSAPSAPAPSQRPGNAPASTDRTTNPSDTRGPSERPGSKDPASGRGK